MDLREVWYSGMVGMNEGLVGEQASSKQMLSSNDSSLMHHFLATWREELKEAARQRGIDAAQARTAQMHNAQ